MKLSDFITTVLVDIENRVNSAGRTTNRYTYLHTIGNKGDEGVEFDVAITAGGEAPGKIGAEVFSVVAKTEGKVTSEEVSRIRFIVMVGNYIKKK
ncbi:hypothetical protein KBC70_04035 [Candidatus Woesebacteria bacterium]|nr:hypothetical protein [Candidatus Woesebacteria bacterium]